MFKPRVTPSEVEEHSCDRLALIEGQKENTMEAQKEERTMVKQEEDTEGYKVIGWIFLILAVILLLNATMLDPRKSQFGLVLFIFGNLSLVLGATITYLPRRKKE